jgi:hypothetical protein
VKYFGRTLSFSNKTAHNYNPRIISNHLLSSSGEKVRQQSGLLLVHIKQIENIGIILCRAIVTESHAAICAEL